MRGATQLVKVWNAKLSNALSRRASAHAFLVGLFAFYLVMGVIMNVVFPLGEAPDEPAHFAYVRYVARNRALPVMKPRYEDNETVEAFQAPAYYILAALLAGPAIKEEARLGLNPAFSFVSQGPRVPTFYPLPERHFPWRGVYLAWHITRFFSLILGAVSLWATYQTALLVFRSRWLAVSTVAYLALNPQFIYLHSVVTNDALATAAGSLITLAAIRLLYTPTLRNFAIAALGIALAALSKPSALMLCPGLALALAKAWRAFSSWRERWFALGILIAIPVGCSGWWFLRNLRLYGDLTGLSVVKQAYSGNYYPEPLSVGRFLYLLPQMFRQTSQSSWGLFGWLSFSLPQWIFYAIILVHVPPLVGLLVKPPFSLSPHSIVTVLGGSWLGLIAGFLFYNTVANSSGWQGRFLFPGLSVAGLVFVGGWKRWFMRREARSAVVISALGTALVLYALTRVIFPMYLPPRTLPDDAPVPNRLDADFAGGLQLVGYKLEPDKARPGSDLRATLYWRTSSSNPRPYRFFLEGRADNGTPIVTRTESLLPLRYPPAIWPENKIVVSHDRLRIPQAVQQTVGFLQVEVFEGHQETQQVPHVDQAGNPLANTIRLGKVIIGSKARSR